MIQLIEHNSFHYWKLVSLRDEILRKPLNLEFSKEELFNEDKQFHFACFENDEIIAGLILVPSESNTIKMRQVCVSNSKQGQGIGNKLVLFTENWAKEKGFKEMYCHARQNALNFYLKQDYQIEGESFLEVGLQHFKLVKVL